MRAKLLEEAIPCSQRQFQASKFTNTSFTGDMKAKMRKFSAFSLNVVSLYVVGLTHLRIDSNLKRLVVRLNSDSFPYARQLFCQLPSLAHPLPFGGCIGQRAGAALLDYRVPQADTGKAFSL